jgi:hypothetical protein
MLRPSCLTHLQGGSNVKGLWLMEQLYPEEGSSLFARDPKLKAELDKEVKKGTIVLPDPNKPIDVDDDQDARIDECLKEIWAYYDKKNTGFMDKVCLLRCGRLSRTAYMQQKQAKTFMEDALQVFATRKGRQPKELVSPQLGLSKVWPIRTCDSPVARSHPRRLGT